MRAVIRNLTWLGMMFALLVGITTAQDNTLPLPTLIEASVKPVPASNGNPSGNMGNMISGNTAVLDFGWTFFYEFVWYCPHKGGCDGDDLGHRIIQVVPDTASVTFDSVTVTKGNCFVETPSLLECNWGHHARGKYVYVRATGTRSSDADYVVFNYEWPGPVELTRVGFIFAPLEYGTPIGDNLSFESGFAGWKRTNLSTKTAVKCEQLNAPDGSCVLKLMPSRTLNQKVTKKLTVSSLDANDYLWVGFDNRANSLVNTSNARVTVRMTFDDNTVWNGSRNIAPGTYGWQNTWFQMTAWKDVKSVTILIENKEISKGNWQLDNIKIVPINLEDLPESS